VFWIVFRLNAARQLQLDVSDSYIPPFCGRLQMAMIDGGEAAVEPGGYRVNHSDLSQRVKL
jgi:hypothetical protein